MVEIVPSVKNQENGQGIFANVNENKDKRRIVIFFSKTQKMCSG